MTKAMGSPPFERSANVSACPFRNRPLWPIGYNAHTPSGWGGEGAFAQHNWSAFFLTSVWATLHSARIATRRPSDRVQYRCCDFEIAAERIGELHLPWCAALRFEDRRRGDQDAQALRARRRDVQPVERIQELHAARRIRVARRRQGIDDDRRLLPLKLVDRADPRSPAGVPEARRPARCRAR